MTGFFYVRIALSVVFAILAAILAVKSIDGWGWFLFCAFCAVPSMPE